MNKLMKSAVFACVASVLGTAAMGQSIMSWSEEGYARKVSYGPYMRGELSYNSYVGGDGTWQPPGFPADPQIYFDTSLDNVASGTIAYGWDRSNGLRYDVSLTRTAEQDFSAPWSYTVPAVPGPHATMTGSVATTALMANVFYGPEPDLNAPSRIEPFVTAGLGIASNRMSSLTRTNPAAAQPVRLFEDNTDTSFAWTVGAGVAIDVAKQGSRPVYLDLTYRYSDYGDAVGGSVPLPGSGVSEPVMPFTFDNAQHSISFGVRVPLGRN